MVTNGPPSKDVFISHAGEDKDAIARPLAEELESRGLSVWFDEYELVPSDSLRRKIGEGLKRSRLGVVILSPTFFEKDWPKRELDVLTERHVYGELNVIVPVWHEIGLDELRAHAPLLDDLVGVRSSVGVPAIADGIVAALNRPGAVSRRRRAAAGGVAALIAVAALAVLLVVPGTKRKTDTVRAGDMSLTLDPPARAVSRSRAAIPGLRLEQAVAAELGDDATLVAGRLRDPAPGRDAAPLALQQRFLRPQAAETVRMGKVETLSYATRLEDGSRMLLFVIPTASSYYAIGCQATRSWARAKARCESVASTARFSGPPPQSVGPSHAVGARLKSLFRTLDRQRSAAAPMLNNGSRSVRAQAARRLEHGHRMAAEAVAHIHPLRVDEAPVADLKAALVRLADAFDRLHKAAEQNRPASYEDARAQVASGDAALRRARAGLARNRYSR